MNIEDIKKEWEKDSVIGKDLVYESLGTASLHSKYINLAVDAKIRLSKTQADLNQLRLVKFKYYRGEMTKDELAELGWTQWQGVKPLKAEMDEFLQGDADMNKTKLRLEYLTSMVYLLESIVGAVKSRDWQIRNAIEYSKFKAGA